MFLQTPELVLMQNLQPLQVSTIPSVFPRVVSQRLRLVTWHLDAMVVFVRKKIVQRNYHDQACKASKAY